MCIRDRYQRRVHGQENKVIVGMCGDGANDCSALKAADVGVSLSEAEASIAAPFTSRIPNISCVVSLLQEGRASLVTSFQCFKYTALYSQIQFFCMSSLYFQGADLTDWEYLYSDLFVVFPLTILMSYTLPAEKLSRKQPTSSLVSPSMLVSVIGQLLIAVGFQFGLSFFLTRQSRDWYTPCSVLHPKELDRESVDGCYENTTLFLFILFQYLGTLFAFTISRPFKKPIYTNFWFTLLSLFSIGFLFYLLLAPAKPVKDFFLLMDIPNYWKYTILAAGLSYVAVVFIYEKLIVRCLLYMSVSYTHLTLPTIYSV
eukprot:TRINITY_DN2640_c0_g1_i3.p1 TRINITY_DN2640_c0_g1~~TRINITY_DN2640_c0_g1_i3.p1  ORF type:complete len:314 (+),score=48.46 TRINITY_DN2640_c0_g1_i3:64-1005(+)